MLPCNRWMIGRSLLLVLLVSTASVAVGAGSDHFRRAIEGWPQFRGPTGQGHAQAGGLPLHFSETNQVKWKTAIPGTGWSSPVILENKIWFSTALEEGRSLRAIGVDQESGRILHDVEIFTVEKPEFKHALNSYASPTPVVEKGRVYISFGDYGTACLDTGNGKVIWKNRELRLDHENGPGSSPILFEDKLIIPCDGTNVQYIAALYKKDGTVAWRTDRSGKIDKAPPMKKAYSTPLVVPVGGKAQLIIPAAEYLYSYDPHQGRELWKLHYPGFSNVPRPIFGHGLLYICTGFGKPELWAIRPDGQGDVGEKQVAWKVTRQAPAKPSPILVGEHLFMVSDNGIATCLDAKTGKEKWQERLGAEFSASPVYASQHLFFPSHDGRVFVIAPAPEFKPVATNQFASGFMASPAVVDNALFLRSKTHLYRIQK